MQKKRVDRILLGLLVLAVAGFVYIIRDSFEQRIIDKGDSAPSFSIRADDGRTFTPNDFGGKVLVLNFWASWCPPCVEETPSLSEFQKQMKNQGVIVLAVSVDKNEKAYRDFLGRFKPAFITARDPNASINADYGTFKFPETYVIRDGKVVAKYISGRDWTSPDIVNEIRSFL